MIGDACQHVGESGLRIDIDELRRLDQRAHDTPLPPESEPQKVQLLRPTAISRTARSAALFDRQTN
jgi:hypothetical protein